MTARFRVNSSRVMHETIEGEVILIDVTTGNYYSLRDTGAEIWKAIEQGADQEEISETLIRRYAGPREEIRSAVGLLLQELTDEGLIEPSADGSADRLPLIAPLDSATGRYPFQVPALERYTDMQDLILLDPVHEVDSRGWPHPAEPETKSA